MRKTTGLLTLTPAGRFRTREHQDWSRKCSKKLPVIFTPLSRDIPTRCKSYKNLLDQLLTLRRNKLERFTLPTISIQVGSLPTEGDILRCSPKLAEMFQTVKRTSLLRRRFINRSNKFCNFCRRSRRRIRRTRRCSDATGKPLRARPSPGMNTINLFNVALKDQSFFVAKKCRVSSRQCWKHSL
jgi:hypothetical protein